MWRKRAPKTFLTALLFCLSVASAIAAPAPTPAAQCRAVGTDDTLRPIPELLIAKAREVFKLQAMTADQIQRSTFYRCFAGHALICTRGANLPCGKADMRQDLPGASEWCAAHPDADFVPMYALGHDTIYRWQCQGGKAAIVGTRWKVDERGFIAALWKRA